MIDRNDFRAWVLEALRILNGSGSVLAVTKVVWSIHEADLRQAGDLFYTWQYDVRWAAQYLRNEGYLQPVDRDRTKPWELSPDGWSVSLEEASARGPGKRPR